MPATTCARARAGASLPAARTGKWHRAPCSSNCAATTLPSSPVAPVTTTWRSRKEVLMGWRESEGSYRSERSVFLRREPGDARAHRAGLGRTPELVQALGHALEERHQPLGVELAARAGLLQLGHGLLEEHQGFRRTTGPRVAA